MSTHLNSAWPRQINLIMIMLNNVTIDTTTIVPQRWTEFSAHFIYG